MNLEKLILGAIATVIIVAIPVVSISTKKFNEYKNQTTELELELKDVKNSKEELEKQIEDINKQNRQLKEQLSLKTQPKRTRLAVSSSGVCDDYRGTVSKYFGSHTEQALAIMHAESTCNPLAKNLSDNHGGCIGSFGLFQLACFWTDDPFDPEVNIAKAYEIYTRSGWSPWSVCKNGTLDCST